MEDAAGCGLGCVVDGVWCSAVAGCEDFSRCDGSDGSFCRAAR